MRLCIMVKEASSWRRRQHILWTNYLSEEDLVKVLFEIIEELPASSKKSASAFETQFVDTVEMRLNRLGVRSLKRNKSSNPNTFLCINAERRYNQSVHVIDYKVEVGRD